MRRRMVLLLLAVSVGFADNPGLSVLAADEGASPSHRLTVSGRHFQLDGADFAYTGLSFFNALYNPTFSTDSAARRRWLASIHDRGITVLRVWCQWDNGLGFVDAGPGRTLYAADGSLRPAPLAGLKAILADADRFGMCLEIVLFAQESWSQGIRLDAPADELAVAAVARELERYRNASFQIWNEHSDARVLTLLAAIRSIDPQRLVTNAPGYSSDLGADEQDRAMDYLTPHTTRSGRHWELASAEIASLRARYAKPVVDDEPARSGTARFGGPLEAVSPFDTITHMILVMRSGGYPTYHHDMFQTGYGTPSCPISGMPDPDFSPDQRLIFDFLSCHGRYAAGMP